MWRALAHGYLGAAARSRGLVQCGSFQPRAGARGSGANSDIAETQSAGTQRPVAQFRRSLIRSAIVTDNGGDVLIASITC